MSTPRDMAHVVTTAMQKGGVGKTTSTVNLARALAVAGRRVLVCDLDPQGNATDALAEEDLPTSSVSVADTMLPESALPPGAEPITMRDVIVPTIWNGVDLAPVTNSAALTRVENLLQTTGGGREHRLREALEPVLADYDLVLVDNAPALGLLLENALVAAHDVLVVMTADRWSSQGLARLRGMVHTAQRYSNPALGWAGVLISMWRNTNDEVEKLADIGQHFPDAEVWATPEDTSKVVPQWVSIMECINAGLGLDQSRKPRLRVLAQDVYGWMAQRLIARRTTREVAA